LIAMGAINVVNIKLMKSGFVEALDIAAVCRATHTQLINGGTQHVTYMLDVPIMAGRIPGSVNSWKGGNVDVPGFPPGYRSRLYTNESSYLPNIARPLSPFLGIVRSHTSAIFLATPTHP